MIRRAAAGFALVFALAGCARLRSAADVYVYRETHPSAKVRIYTVPSYSMAPTLVKGSVAVADETYYAHAQPQDGDIVVFESPIRSLSPWLKRVVAVPGERFTIPRGTHGATYGIAVRNYTIVVDYGGGYRPLKDPMMSIPARSQWAHADRVPDDCFILLGDNRNWSVDSHMFGCARRDQLLGKVVAIEKP